MPLPFQSPAQKPWEFIDLGQALHYLGRACPCRAARDAGLEMF